MPVSAERVPRRAAGLQNFAKNSLRSPDCFSSIICLYELFKKFVVSGLLRDERQKCFAAPQPAAPPGLP